MHYHPLIHQHPIQIQIQIRNTSSPNPPPPTNTYTTSSSCATSTHHHIPFPKPLSHPCRRERHATLWGGKTKDMYCPSAATKSNVNERGNKYDYLGG